MATDDPTQHRRGLGLARPGARPRDPGDLGDRPRHRPRCRLGRRHPRRHRHADLLRLPGQRRSSPSRSRRRCASAASTKLRARAPALAALDHRLDQRRGPREAARLRHRPAGRRHGRRRPADRPRQPHGRRRTSPIACPRCGSTAHRARSASSARRRARPATAAATAWSPSTTSSASERTRRPTMARFHSLDVTDVRRETRDAVVVTLGRATRTPRSSTSPRAST